MKKLLICFLFSLSVVFSACCKDNETVASAPDTIPQDILITAICHEVYWTKTFNSTEFSVEELNSFNTNIKVQNYLETVFGIEIEQETFDAAYKIWTDKQWQNR